MNRKTVPLLLLLLLLCPVPGAGALAAEEETPPPTLTSPIVVSDLLPRNGNGWTWSGPTRVLTLVDGLTIRTTGPCVSLPQGSTVKALGSLTLLCEEPPPEEEKEEDPAAPAEKAKEETTAPKKEAAPLPTALDLGAGGKLVLAEGSVLTLTSRGDGIRAGELSFTNCTLKLQTVGNGLRVTGLTLGEGTDTTLVCGGIGIQADGERGVTIAGKLSITASQGGILAPSAGRGDRITLAQGSEVAIRSEGAGAFGVDAGGGVVVAGPCTVTSGGTGLRAAAGRALSVTAPLSVTAGTGPALTVGGAFAAEETTVRLSSADAAGLSAGGDVTLTAAQLTIEQAGESGLTAGGRLSVDADSNILVGKTGEYGVSAQGLVTVEGALTVQDALGDGLVSHQAGLRLSGTAALKAGGAGVRCALGITCEETGLLTVEAGGDGVLSQSGPITLAVRPGAEGRIDAGGNGVVSGSGVSLCQPGFLTIRAGGMGVYAQGDVSVGGVEGARCDLEIACQANSIWSENGNVFLRACGDCYFFDESIHVNSAVGKTLSVLEGAGLVFGMRSGFAVGIFRKDYTITAEKTPALLVLRTLQIGAEHTVTVAAGAQVKAGPLILGRNARFLCAEGSRVYYNGPVTQVTGQVTAFATAAVDLTGGTPVLPPGASWDGKTLTLRDVMLDVPQGPALTLPAGSALRLEGTTRITVGGTQGSAISSDGDLTVEGGTLSLSGGACGIEAAGDLTLSGTAVSVRGAGEAALSAGRILARGGSLECDGDGTALRARDGIVIDGLPQGVAVVRQGEWSVLQSGGQAMTRVTLTPDAVPGSTVQTETAPDGTRTETTTDRRTGVVTVCTTAPDGTVNLKQTRPDGVTVHLSAPAGSPLAGQVTLPSGMSQTVVSLPVSDGGPGTVPALLRADEAPRPIPLSLWRDGSLVFRVEGAGQITLLDARPDLVDVPSTAWCYEPVVFAVTRNLMEGVGDGRFDPGGTTTCAMAVTILHRLCGAPETQSPPAHPLLSELDPEAYYAPALTWAVSTGMTGDGADGFLPQSAVTRQQLALLFYRCADALGLDKTPQAPLSTYTDGDDAAPWARTALRWATAQGILQGRTDGSLAPDATATRAEVAAMLQRYIALALIPPVQGN